MNKNKMLPKPFVKWLGGKTSILKDIMPHMLAGAPGQTYYEPFAGGCAVFFELHNRGILKDQKVCLSDRTAGLVDCYNVIRDNPHELIKALEEHKKNHNKDYYYKVRSDHHPKSPVDTAARFIYLNKTCFNGLHRENKKGEFNVPIGSYTNPKILDEQNLLNVSKALKDVDIRYQDFEAITPSKGDFVFLDPPTHPAYQTSCTGYSHFSFMEEDHERLKRFLMKLQSDGVCWMLCNSDTPFIRELYGFNYKNKTHEKEMQGRSMIDPCWSLYKVRAPRLINSKVSDRKNKAAEVIIVNY